MRETFDRETRVWNLRLRCQWTMHIVFAIALPVPDILVTQLVKSESHIEQLEHELKRAEVTIVFIACYLNFWSTSTRTRMYRTTFVSLEMQA